MSALLSGVIGAVAATALAVAARRWPGGAAPDADGWVTLRPNWLLNGTILVTAGLTGLFVYVLLFVGSSRADAASQMRYLLALAIAFGLGCLYTSWASYGRAIAWKGDRLRVRRRLGGGETLHLLSDLQSIERQDMRNEYRLTFRDGAILRISTYFTGAEDLAARAEEGIQA